MPETLTSNVKIDTLLSRFLGALCHPKQHKEGCPKIGRKLSHKAINYAGACRMRMTNNQVNDSLYEQINRMLIRSFVLVTSCQSL